MPARLFYAPGAVGKRAVSCDINPQISRDNASWDTKAALGLNLESPLLHVDSTRPFQTLLPSASHHCCVLLQGSICKALCRFLRRPVVGHGGLRPMPPCLPHAMPARLAVSKRSVSWSYISKAQVAKATLTLKLESPLIHVQNCGHGISISTPVPFHSCYIPSHLMCRQHGVVQPKALASPALSMALVKPILSSHQLVLIWGFPNIRGTFLGVPIIRILVFWGLYWGPFILGNYYMTLPELQRRAHVCSCWEHCFGGHASAVVHAMPMLCNPENRNGLFGCARCATLEQVPCCLRLVSVKAWASPW